MLDPKFIRIGDSTPPGQYEAQMKWECHIAERTANRQAVIDMCRDINALLKRNADYKAGTEVDNAALEQLRLDIAFAKEERKKTPPQSPFKITMKEQSEDKLC